MNYKSYFGHNLIILTSWKQSGQVVVHATVIDLTFMQFFIFSSCFGTDIQFKTDCINFLRKTVSSCVNRSERTTILYVSLPENYPY